MKKAKWTLFVVQCGATAWALWNEYKFQKRLSGTATVLGKEVKYNEGNPEGFHAVKDNGTRLINLSDTYRNRAN